MVCPSNTFIFIPKTVSGSFDKCKVRIFPGQVGVFFNAREIPAENRVEIQKLYVVLAPQKIDRNLRGIMRIAYLPGEPVLKHKNFKVHPPSSTLNKSINAKAVC